MTAKPKLGELLIQAGLLDEFQLECALGEQRRWGGRIGETVVRLGMVDDGRMLRLLSRTFGVPMIRLRDKSPAPDAFERIPRELAEKHLCLPLFIKREGTLRTLYVGLADPTDLRTVDELSFRAGMPVRPVLASPIELRDAIDRLYVRSARGIALGELEETPLAPEDTAPVLGMASLVSPDAPDEAEESHATAASRAPAPHRRSDDIRREIASLAEPEPQFGQRPSPAPRAALEPPPELANESASAQRERPRELPTRQILRALVRLLIAKNVITRAELMQQVREAEERRDDDA